MPEALGDPTGRDRGRARRPALAPLPPPGPPIPPTITTLRSHVDAGAGQPAPGSSSPGPAGSLRNSAAAPQGGRRRLGRRRVRHRARGLPLIAAGTGPGDYLGRLAARDPAAAGRCPAPTSTPRLRPLLPLLPRRARR